MPEPKVNYAVDLAVAPEELLLGLINHDNNLTLGFDTLIFAKAPVPALQGAIRNTTIEIRTTDPIYDIKILTVTYNRIDLSDLFSVVGCEVREVDVAEELVVINSRLFAEIERKYGILLRPEDFDGVQDNGRTILRAKPTNIAYQGEMVITLESSLRRRVPIRILGDYDWSMPANDLRRHVHNTIIHKTPLDSKFKTPKPNATLLSYGIDWTEYRSFITLSGATFSNKVNLAARLATFGIVIDGVWPTGTDRATSAYEDADQSYDRVITTNYTQQGGFEGILMFHYNLA